MDLPPATAPDECPPDLPPGPLTGAELGLLPRSARQHYVALWHNAHLRRDLPRGVLDRARILCGQHPEGVLVGYTAAAAWSGPSAPETHAGVRDVPLLGHPPLFRPAPDVEMWTPRPRSPSVGRRFRSGALPRRCVTEVDGLPVTTPVRTCLDLARWAPAGPAPVEAVVAVELMGRGLPGLLSATADPGHPDLAGASRLTRLGSLVADVDPRSPSPEVTRVRLTLARAGLGPVASVRAVHLDAGVVTPDLVLSGPRVALFVHSDQWLDVPPERARVALHGAGWTVVVVGSEPERPDLLGPFYLDTPPEAIRVAEALWRAGAAVRVLAPSSSALHVSDPVGFWGADGPDRLRWSGGQACAPW